MPFELGLTVMAAMEHPARHTWCVKSLSDLSGTAVYVHDGTIEGLFRELCNALVRVKRGPTVQQMKEIYRVLDESCPEVMARAGTRSLFGARVFAELVVSANKVVKLQA
jgi:hypothetical protein